MIEFPANHLRNSHSRSLMSHTDSLPELIKTHNPAVMVNRHPSLPALTPDLSTEMINETTHRKKIHKELYDKDPTSFRRRLDTSSSSLYLDMVKKSTDLLNNMHALKDKDGIIPKTFTYSRIESQQLSEHSLNHEDFVKPHDPLNIHRTTGYNSGHIRSILSLDTFGPQHSMSIEHKRSLGQLPESPNIDRFFIERQASTPLNRDKMTEILANKIDEEKEDMKSLNSSSSSRGTGKQGSTYSSSLHSLVGVNKDVVAGTLGYYGDALTDEERSLGDIKYRRSSYFNEYRDKLKDQKRRVSESVSRREFSAKMCQEAAQERELVEEFEGHLESVTMNCL